MTVAEQRAAGLESEEAFLKAHPRLMRFQDRFTPVDAIGWDGQHWWNIGVKHTLAGRLLLVPMSQWPPSCQIFVATHGPRYEVMGFAFANTLGVITSIPEPAMGAEFNSLLDWNQFYGNIRLPRPWEITSGLKG